jgi:hypothetical protein
MVSRFCVAEEVNNSIHFTGLAVARQCAVVVDIHPVCATGFLGCVAPGREPSMSVRVVERFQHVLMGNAVEYPVFLGMGQKKDVIGGEAGHSREIIARLFPELDKSCLQKENV